MIIIFYGSHSKDWMDVLNNKLITDFLNYTNINITEIKNVLDINTLTNILANIDLSSVFIIPLMENHMEELHKHNIKALMPSLEHIKMFSCKKISSLLYRSGSTDHIQH